MSDDDGNYFKDADGLSDYVLDTRAADTRTVSNAADARALIDTFRADTSTGPWTSLDRGTVADRLAALVDNPRLLQQGSLNLCGRRPRVSSAGARATQWALSNTPPRSSPRASRH